MSRRRERAITAFLTIVVVLSNIALALHAFADFLFFAAVVPGRTASQSWRSFESGSVLGIIISSIVFLVIAVGTSLIAIHLLRRPPRATLGWWRTLNIVGATLFATASSSVLVVIEVDYALSHVPPAFIHTWTPAEAIAWLGIAGILLLPVSTGLQIGLRNVRNT